MLFLLLLLVTQRSAWFMTLFKELRFCFLDACHYFFLSVFYLMLFSSSSPSLGLDIFCWLCWPSHNFPGMFRGSQKEHDGMPNSLHRPLTAHVRCEALH